MSHPTIAALAALVVLGLGSGLTGCGGGKPASDEPTTAKEKQAREAREKGEDDGGKKWGGWRYQGNRDDCFYVVGRKCFKTEDAACQSLRCKSKKCDVSGGGPATVACAK